jgi:hypothetical protein
MQRARAVFLSVAYPAVKYFSTLSQTARLLKKGQGSDFLYKFFSNISLSKKN